MILNFFSKKNKLTEESEMGFLDHLEELRWHILRAVVSILVFAIVIFINKSFTFDTVIFGPLNKDFVTYRFLCWLSPATCMEPPVMKLITREFGEQLFVHLTVSFWLGLTLAFPYIFWEIWKFISPGLYEHERRSARGIVMACSFLFFLGVSFGYFVMAPIAINFLGNYTVGTFAENSPTLSSYVNYLTMFTLPTGLLFELPIVAYFFGKIGLISSEFLRKYRRHAIVIIFIVAAIVTPPDVVTQIIIATPILALYEVGILIVKRLENQSKEVRRIE